MALGIEQRDPFQGQDIDVAVYSTGLAGDRVLGGSFTGFMAQIQCTTEAYLALNQRVPRMLDGEYITHWMLEQGLQTNTPVADSFGKPFAQAFAAGRGNQIPRKRRFNIVMKTVIPQDFTIDEATFFTEQTDVAKLKVAVKLHYSRIDNGNFGVRAGKSVASSAWQGTTQHVSVITGDAATDVQ